MNAFRRRKKIYIFPNRYGFLGFLLFVVMILAGATYQNNSVFMMAFLLLSLGLIAILHTARNIRDVDILSIIVDPGFAGSETSVKVTAKNHSHIKFGLALELKTKETKTELKIEEIPSLSTTVHSTRFLLPPKRGNHRFSRIKLSTSYPYGLFTSWTFLKLDSQIIAYPKPSGIDIQQNSYFVGQEDFSGHKTYEKSDNPSRIDWKVYSRRNVLVTKEFKSGTEVEHLFDWSKISLPDSESKLSQLSLWLTQAHKANHQYRLILPALDTQLSRGLAHYRKCMAHLAEYKC